MERKGTERAEEREVKELMKGSGAEVWGREKMRGRHLIVGS